MIVRAQGIALRGSSGFYAFQDRVLVSALAFIHDHLARGIRAPDVLAHVLLSRLTLEKKFKHHLGRTIAEEILRTRLERADHLLRETSLPMEQVAEHSGYADTKTFYRNFRAAFGCTPGERRNAGVSGLESSLAAPERG